MTFEDVVRDSCEKLSCIRRYCKKVELHDGKIKGSEEIEEN